MKILSHQDFSVLQNADPSIVAGGQLFALVDHAGIPGLAKQLSKMRVQWLSLFEGSRDEGALEVAPLLFPIDADQNSFQRKALLRWIGERGTFTSSMLFLVSPLSMPELARRLALRLDASLPDEMEIVLRFFDTRVFEQLLIVLSDEQRDCFLNVAHCWWFVDRRGALQYVSATFAETGGCDVPLVLSTKQEAALLDASEPDQVAQLLRTFVPNEYAELVAGQAYDFIIKHMRAARAFGVASTHDHALYCSLALLEGEDFSEREKWSAALEKFGRGTSLSDAIESAGSYDECEIR